MPSSKTIYYTTVRAFYVTSQFLSIGSAFSGSMLGIYDYTHPNQRMDVSYYHYIWIFSLGTAAASIGSFTSNKFQGEKIGLEKEDHHAPPLYSKDIAPQNPKSTLFESAYLIFAASLSLANNYLFIAGFNAFLNDSKYPILPPGPIGILIFLFKNFIMDLPLDGTSAIYETTEEIKNDITKSKADTLLSRFLYPIAIRKKLLTSLILWIQTVGISSHTGTDVGGFILSVPSFLSLLPSTPKAVTFSDFIHSPHLMYPVLLIAAYLFVANNIQALYFEAKESEHNLKRIRNDNIHTSIYKIPQDTQTKPEDRILHRLFRWQPRLIPVIRAGFYTQGPLHAFGDVMPVILFLRDIFHRHDALDSPAIIMFIISSSAIVFAGSCLGTHHSEVATAIHHFDEEFEYLSPSLSHSSHEN